MKAEAAIFIICVVLNFIFLITFISFLIIQRRIKGSKKVKKVKKQKNKDSYMQYNDSKSGKKSKGKKSDKGKCESNNEPSSSKWDKKLSVCISDYPGSTSGVTGRVRLFVNGLDMTIKYGLEGVEPSLNQTDFDTSAGLHMHRGTSCSDANAIGKRHWNDFGNATKYPNPWTSTNGAFYASNSDGKAFGSFNISNGYYWGENQGHVMIVKAANADGVGCGIIKTGISDCGNDDYYKNKGNDDCNNKKSQKSPKAKSPKKSKSPSKKKSSSPTSSSNNNPVNTRLSACISDYPGSTVGVSGEVNIIFQDLEMTIEYNMSGLEASLTATNVASSTLGAGLHMHVGTLCSNSSAIGRRWWNDFGNETANPNPWRTDRGAHYVTNSTGGAVGSFNITNGYDLEDNEGRVMIVKRSDGGGVGCGVIKTGGADCD